MKIQGITIGIILAAALMLGGCKGEDEMPNQKLADYVDIDRFMGTWYVHGYTPTFLDKNAYAATETYEMRDDGKIDTTYRFRKGGPDKKWKEMNPTGKVHNEETNSEWRMRFFGLFSSPYYILYVSDNYEETVIGVRDKDMAWVMTRSPEIDEATYDRLVEELRTRDYELENLQRVEHPEEVAATQ